MSINYWEEDQNPVPKCIAFIMNFVNVVRGFVPYICSLRNRCLLTHKHTHTHTQTHKNTHTHTHKHTKSHTHTHTPHTHTNTQTENEYDKFVDFDFGKIQNSNFFKIKNSFYFVDEFLSSDCSGLSFLFFSLFCPTFFYVALFLA